MWRSDRGRSGGGGGGGAAERGTGAASSADVFVIDEPPGAAADPGSQTLSAEWGGAAEGALGGAAGAAGGPAGGLGNDDDVSGRGGGWACDGQAGGACVDYRMNGMDVMDG